MIHAAHINDARVEGAVLQTIKDWGTANPAELVAFDRQMKILRSEQDRGGRSQQGELRHYGEVPVTLAKLMAVRFGKDWTIDKKLLVHFFNHFRVGRVSLGKGAPYIPASARSEM